METIFIYFLKTILCSGVMFSYYLLFLKDKTFHHYNRFYLLSTVAISLTLPLLKISYFTIELNPKIVLLLEKFNYHSQTNNNDVFYFQVGFAILGLVAVFNLIKFLVGIFRIQQFKKIYPKESGNGIDFYMTDLENAPFSFFNNLFWKNSILLNSDLGKQILKHEMVHIEQKHSLDKIIVEVLKNIFWFNPFFWLIKKEIHLIHEYLADKKAVKNTDTKAFAQMILGSHFSGNVLPATNPFLNSNLKKRLNMLQKSKTKFGYLRKILALPLLFAIGFIYLVNAKNKEIETTNKMVEELIENQVQEIQNDTIRPETTKIESFELEYDNGKTKMKMIKDSATKFIATSVYKEDDFKSHFSETLKDASDADVFKIDKKIVSKKEFEDFLNQNSISKDYIYGLSESFREENRKGFFISRNPSKEEYEETMKNLREKLNKQHIEKITSGFLDRGFDRDMEKVVAIYDSLTYKLKEGNVKVNEVKINRKDAHGNSYEIRLSPDEKNNKKRIYSSVTEYKEDGKPNVDNPWMIGVGAHATKDMKISEDQMKEILKDAEIAAKNAAAAAKKSDDALKAAEKAGSNAQKIDKRITRNLNSTNSNGKKDKVEVTKIQVEFKGNKNKAKSVKEVIEDIKVSEKEIKTKLIDHDMLVYIDGKKIPYAELKKYDVKKVKKIKVEKDENGKSMLIEMK